MNFSLASSAASAAAIALVLAFAPDAGAQTWPAKTVRIVMPFPPGGGAEPVGSTPEELGVFFGREAAKYAKVIARAKIQADQTGAMMVAFKFQVLRR